MDERVEAIERATFAAVPPQALRELPGWLLGLDDGTVGRAHSAVPLRHQSAPALPLQRIEAAYAERRLQAVFRLPSSPAFDVAARALARVGYTPRQPTEAQFAPLSDVAQLQGHAVALAAQPDAAWVRLFLGEGTSAQDAASRLAILRRAEASIYASVRIDGELAAVGVGCVAHGWCGMHGMRTAAGWRGRGCAGAILGALARQAIAAGATLAFLQVEQANAPAQAVYRRAGFAVAWQYAYWRRTT